MVRDASSKKILAFFFQNGPTLAMFRWLHFRLFVAQNEVTLRSDSTGLAAHEYLILWGKQTDVKRPSSWIFFLLIVVTGVVGFVSMAGVLNYTASHPINIWIPIALFAVMPFVLSLSSFYLLLFTWRKRNLRNQPLLQLFVKRLKLSQFLDYSNLLYSWLFWQVQRLSLSFTVSAVCAFFILATFQDYQFGWSSTLISDNATMTQLMAVISWPWHWFIAPPSAELVSASRFSAQSIDAFTANGNDWWRTMVMAILTYGVLPRAILLVAARARFIRQLKWSILNSSDIEQFLIAQQHQASQNPIQSDAIFHSPQTVNLNQMDSDFINWQQSASGVSVIKTLGLDEWRADLQWLESGDSVRQRPVSVLVALSQTPTGDLADSIEILEQKNKTVWLVVIASSAKTERADAQLKSWLFFAKQHRFTLKLGE